MTTRAADDAAVISARLAQFEAQRIAREAARARGCHERQDGQPLCAFSDCPFCRPEKWEAPQTPATAPAGLAVPAVVVDLGPGLRRVGGIGRQVLWCHGLRLPRPQRFPR